MLKLAWAKFSCLYLKAFLIKQLVLKNVHPRFLIYSVVVNLHYWPKLLCHLLLLMLRLQYLTTLSCVTSGNEFNSHWAISSSRAFGRTLPNWLGGKIKLKWTQIYLMWPVLLPEINFSFPYTTIPLLISCEDNDD